jgi:hypothetical protein
MKKSSMRIYQFYFSFGRSYFRFGYLGLGKLKKDCVLNI